WQSTIRPKTLLNAVGKQPEQVTTVSIAHRINQLFDRRFAIDIWKQITTPVSQSSLLPVLHLGQERICFRGLSGVVQFVGSVRQPRKGSRKQSGPNLMCDGVVRCISDTGPRTVRTHAVQNGQSVRYPLVDEQLRYPRPYRDSEQIVRVTSTPRVSTLLEK